MSCLRILFFSYRRGQGLLKFQTFLLIFTPILSRNSTFLCLHLLFFLIFKQDDLYYQSLQGCFINNIKNILSRLNRERMKRYCYQGGNPYVRCRTNNIVFSLLPNLLKTDNFLREVMAQGHTPSIIFFWGRVSVRSFSGYVRTSTGVQEIASPFYVLKGTKRHLISIITDDIFKKFNIFKN